MSIQRKSDSKSLLHIWDGNNFHPSSRLPSAIDIDAWVQFSRRVSFRLSSRVSSNSAWECLWDCRSLPRRRGRDCVRLSNFGICGFLPRWWCHFPTQSNGRPNMPCQPFCQRHVMSTFNHSVNTVLFQYSTIPSISQYRAITTFIPYFHVSPGAELSVCLNKLIATKHRFLCANPTIPAIALIHSRYCTYCWHCLHRLIAPDTPIFVFSVAVFATKFLSFYNYHWNILYPDHKLLLMLLPMEWKSQIKATFGGRLKKPTILSCPTFVRQITWGKQNHALRVGRILWTVYASLCPSPCFMSAFLAPPTMSPRFPPLSNNSPFCSPLMATLFTSSDCPHPSFLEQEEHNGAILTSNRNELMILLRSTPQGANFYMEPMETQDTFSNHLWHEGENS